VRWHGGSVNHIIMLVDLDARYLLGLRYTF
jgi:hypothetical protein